MIFFSFYGRPISNQSKWRISLLRHRPQSLTAPPLELDRTSRHAPPPPVVGNQTKLIDLPIQLARQNLKKAKIVIPPFYGEGGGGSIFSLAAAKKNKNTLPDSGCLFHTLLSFSNTCLSYIRHTRAALSTTTTRKWKKTTSTTTPTHTKVKKTFFFFLFFSFH